MVEKVSSEVFELITNYRENIYHIQKFQKISNDKYAKSKSYASDNKV